MINCIWWMFYVNEIAVKRDFFLVWTSGIRKLGNAWRVTRGNTLSPLGVLGSEKFSWWLLTRLWVTNDFCTLYSVGICSLQNRWSCSYHCAESCHLPGFPTSHVLKSKSMLKSPLYAKDSQKQENHSYYHRHHYCFFTTNQKNRPPHRTAWELIASSYRCISQNFYQIDW